MGQRLYFEEVEVGEEIPPLIKEPTQELVSHFVRMMGWDFGLFTDDEQARSMGQEKAIAPGELSLGFLSQMLTDWAFGGTLQHLEAHYRGVVRHGDRLECCGIVTEKHWKEEGGAIECDIFIQNQEGDRPVVGKATLRLLSRPG